MFEELQKTLNDRFTNRTRHQHILQPLLWLCGTFGIGSVVAATRVDGLLQQELFGMGAFCGFFTLSAYAYWSVRDPDRLQTETYRLGNRQLDILERRGVLGKGGIVNDPSEIALSENEPPALEGGVKLESGFDVTVDLEQ